MANEFAMKPGLDNFPGLLSEVASRLNELAAQFGAPADCVMQQGDSPVYHDLWNQQPQTLQDEAAFWQSLADGFGAAGSGFQASDGG